MFGYEYWGNGSFNAKVNMALEEYLLRRATQGKAQARFWTFSKDSVVLGYAQATDAVLKQDNSFDTVRRITGGSHVQTGKNIFAYTFAVPRDGSFRTFEDMRAYYADIVASGLMDLGIENVVVDNQASSVNVDDKVFAAHAIIWGVESALIHGLIVMNPYNMEKLAQRVVLKERKIGNKTYTEYNALKNIPTFSQFLPTPSRLDEEKKNEVLRDALADSILNNLAKDYEKRQVTDQTITEAFRMIEDKHKKPEWIEKRRPPFTKDRIEAIPFEELDGPLKKDLGYCMFLQVKDKDFKKIAEPSI